MKISRRTIKFAIAVVIGILSQFLSPYSAAVPIAYSLTDLGTLGGARSHALAINDNGQIVGWSNTPANLGDEFSHAFIWENGVLSDLGTLGGLRSEAFAINSRGQIVGYSDVSTATNTSQHPVLWQNGEVVDLAQFPGGVVSGMANGINDLGQAVGIGANLNDQYPSAFIYGNGTSQSLGRFSNAFDINDTGQIVGTSFSSGAPDAFLWQNGDFQDLGTFGGSQSAGRAINASGDVVGSAETAAFLNHAFLYHAGTMLDLGTLPGFQESSAVGINDFGEIVGNSSTFRAGSHPFLFSDGVMTDLSPFLDRLTFFAAGLNNHGQIVGDAIVDGQPHAFLLTPVAFVPEPNTLLLMIAGIGCLVLNERKRGLISGRLRRPNERDQALAVLLARRWLGRW